MQQYYRWTGDKAWLKGIGYPIAKGVAEWIESRATLGTDGAYHIEKVTTISGYAVGSILSAFGKPRTRRCLRERRVKL
jgi:hypothetical protein